MTHSHTQDGKKVDTSQVEFDKTGSVDEHGFSVRPPISDRECIYKCLDNCRQMAGLDRKQVARLCDQFKTMSDDIESIESEYPPL